MPEFFQDFYDYAIFDPYVSESPEYQALLAQWETAAAELPEELRNRLNKISLNQIALTGAMSYLRGLSTTL